MERAVQEQTVAINRGLFLIRYAAAEDMSRPPRVAVAPDPTSTQDIAFILHPDHKEAVLTEPDTSLVVRATAASKLFVRVIPAQEGGSVAATVRIEPLNQGKAVPASAPKAKRSSTSQRGDLHVVAHVGGIGDVTANANEWIAGPSAPARIEGMSIAWPDKPADLQIQYAVKTAKAQTVSGRKMNLGAFAGTRGKAMPIVGLMFEMSGPKVESYQLSVEAIFLGAPAKRLTGRRIVASGPTGREPLVGLRIAVETAHAAAESKAPASKPKRSEGRVRVFRSRSTQNQPATV